MAWSGWDAGELSEKTGINPESILELERGSTPVRVSDLRKISAAIK